MALDDDDITTSGVGGEGPADGGSNPQGRDGGADGTAARAKDLLTAGRTRKAKTAERTEPQARAKDLLTAGRTRKAKTGARTEPRDRFSC